MPPEHVEHLNISILIKSVIHLRRLLQVMGKLSKQRLRAAPCLYIDTEKRPATSVCHRAESPQNTLAEFGGGRVLEPLQGSKRGRPAPFLKGKNPHKRTASTPNNWPASRPAGRVNQRTLYI